MISWTLNLIAKRMRPINTVWSEISRQSQARAYERGGWGWDLKNPWAWYFTKTLLSGKCIGLEFYKNKRSVCRRICLLCQQTSLENINITSNCDATNSAHQIQMTTICHWMKTPMKIFCVRRWSQVTTYMPKGKRLKNINCVLPLRPFFPERSGT